MECRQIYDKFKVKIDCATNEKRSFSMTCDKKFFEITKLSILHGGEINVQVEMEKMEKMEKTLNFTFHFVGKIDADCDICLETVSIDINLTANLLVKLLAYPPKQEFTESDDPDIWIVDERATELDLFHYIYESISLALPQKMVHPNDMNGKSTCNPEMLKKIEEFSPNQHQEIDPRWEVLKNIKLN